MTERSPIVSALPLVMPNLLLVVMDIFLVVPKMLSIFPEFRLACAGLLVFKKLLTVSLAVLQVIPEITFILADVFLILTQILAITHDVI